MQRSGMIIDAYYFTAYRKVADAKKYTWKNMELVSQSLMKNID
jgi:hypothetical protein